MAKTAIDMGLFRDLYVALGESLEKIKPGRYAFIINLLSLDLGGGVLIIMGGFLALLDRGIVYDTLPYSIIYFFNHCGLSLERVENTIPIKYLLLNGQPVAAFNYPSLLHKDRLYREKFFRPCLLLNVMGTWCITCHAEHPV